MHSANYQPKDSYQQDLIALLQREVNQVQNLMHALEQEYTALTGEDTRLLEEIVQKKQQTIQELEQTGRQRDALLAANGSTAAEQLESASRQATGSRELDALWNELSLLAEKCQEMNRVNGSIVELASRQSRHALDILHGISPAGASSAELYDQTGYKTFSAKSHSLTKA